MSRPIIKGKDILVNTEFYAWLQSELDAGRKQVRFVDAVLKYFDKPQPFKGRKDMQAHKYVFEVFCHNQIRKA